MLRASRSVIGGDQAFTFIGGTAFSGTTGQLRFEQLGGNTYLLGNQNGDTVADFAIRLEDLHTLQALDLVL